MSDETQAKHLSNEDRLFAAVAAGREQEVERLIAEGVDLDDCEGESGCSVLHEAARAGRLGMVRLLLRHGADVHAMDASLREPIHDAAYGGDVETLRVLVGAGASLSVCDEESHTVAHYAARAGRVAMLEELDRLGALQHTESTEHDTPLSAALRGLGESDAEIGGASACDHLGAARYLVQKGANPNSALVQFCDLPSVRRKDIEVLLDLGADPEYETAGGFRGAFLASRYGRGEVLEVLLDDPRTSQDTLNMTLATLIYSRKPELVGMLLDRGADPRIPEVMKSLPDTLVWFDGVDKLRRHINAHLMAGDIETAMPIDSGESELPAPVSKGFTL